MPLSLDPRTCALVLIDLQQGILSMPLAPNSADTLIERAVTLGRALRAAGGIVVGVHVDFDSSGADRLQQPVDAPMPRPPGGLPADWADFAPAVRDLAPEVTITKHQWGAFHDTGLDLQLRRRGIGTILLGGVATNFGVESTAREAWQHNYAVVAVEDLCSSISPEAHRFSMEVIMPRLAQVRSTEAVLKALGAAQG